MLLLSFIVSLRMAHVFSYSKLFDFTKSVFLRIGCPEEDATLATTVLLSADLRGIDSHGIARLSGYVRLWEAARVNATPSVKILHEHHQRQPSTATAVSDLWWHQKPCRLPLKKQRL